MSPTTQTLNLADAIRALEALPRDQQVEAMRKILSLTPDGTFESAIPTGDTNTDNLDARELTFEHHHGQVTLLHSYVAGLHAVVLAADNEEQRDYIDWTAIVALGERAVNLCQKVEETTDRLWSDARAARILRDQPSWSRTPRGAR